MNDIFTAEFRYFIFRNKTQITELLASDTPEISCVASSELKMSLRGTFYYDEAEFAKINFLSDTLRVFVYIGDDEKQLGEYKVTRNELDKSSQVKTVEIEAYSILYTVSRTRIESRKHFAANTKYIDIVNELLIGAGITKIKSTDSAAVLATDREDWEIGTAHLDIVNQLLSEINYISAWVDFDGYVILEPFASPSADNITQTYRADEFSVIGGDYRVVNDIHDKCNVFIVMCQNPDLNSPMIAKSENDSPTNPYSTVNIGRILSVTQHVDNVPNLNTLQSIADRLKIDSMLSTETVSFVTAINPTHTINDTIVLDNDDLDGIYKETEWTMQLSPSGDMTHKARRVLY